MTKSVLYLFPTEEEASKKKRLSVWNVKNKTKKMKTIDEWKAFSVLVWMDFFVGLRLCSKIKWLSWIKTFSLECLDCTLNNFSWNCFAKRSISVLELTFEASSENSESFFIFGFNLGHLLWCYLGEELQTLFSNLSICS